MRATPFQKACLLLLCISLLLVRVNGAHLHLCFDGEEAPISLHTDDMGTPHTTHELSNPHSDREIYLDGQFLIKKLGGDAAFNLLMWMALPLLWIVGMPQQAIGLFIPRRRRTPIALNPVSFAFHPPAHAPPR